MAQGTEKQPWLSNQPQIPPMFTYYSDDDLGITEQDRAATKPCMCSRFKKQLGHGDSELIPHSILDHTRIEKDKKRMAENLGKGEAMAAACALPPESKEAPKRFWEWRYKL